MTVLRGMPHQPCLMHSPLNFVPPLLGRNLDALNDCLSDLEIPEDSGWVLVLRRYDHFSERNPEVAWTVLDIVQRNSHIFLLFGRRLLALIQSNDPQIHFQPIGAFPVWWNWKEWLTADRIEAHHQRS